MELSKREQELLNFIKAEGKVTINQIEKVLSPQHVGALGTLVRQNYIEKMRIERNPSAVYSITKMITYYMLKEVAND